MKTSKLINQIADRAHVTRTWLREEFEEEVRSIAEAEDETERGTEEMHLIHVLDEQIRRLRNVRDTVTQIIMEESYEQ